MEIILYYGEKLYFIWKFSSGNTDIISFFFQPQRIVQKMYVIMSLCSVFNQILITVVKSN